MSDIANAYEYLVRNDSSSLHTSPSGGDKEIGTALPDLSRMSVIVQNVPRLLAPADVRDILLESVEQFAFLRDQLGNKASGRAVDVHLLPHPHGDLPAREQYRLDNMSWPEFDREYQQSVERVRDTILRSLTPKKLAGMGDSRCMTAHDFVTMLKRLVVRINDLERAGEELGRSVMRIVVEECVRLFRNVTSELPLPTDFDRVGETITVANSRSWDMFEAKRVSKNDSAVVLDARESLDGELVRGASRVARKHREGFREQCQQFINVDLLSFQRDTEAISSFGSLQRQVERGEALLEKTTSLCPVEMCEPWSELVNKLSEGQVVEFTEHERECPVSKLHQSRARELVRGSVDSRRFELCSDHLSVVDKNLRSCRDLTSFDMCSNGATNVFNEHCAVKQFHSASKQSSAENLLSQVAELSKKRKSVVVQEEGGERLVLFSLGFVLLTKFWLKKLNGMAWICLICSILLAFPMTKKRVFVPLGIAPQSVDDGLFWASEMVDMALSVPRFFFEVVRFVPHCTMVAILAGTAKTADVALLQSIGPANFSTKLLNSVLSTTCKTPNDFASSTFDSYEDCVAFFDPQIVGLAFEDYANHTMSFGFSMENLKTKAFRLEMGAEALTGDRRLDVKSALVNQLALRDRVEVTSFVVTVALVVAWGFAWRQRNDRHRNDRR